MRRAQYLIPLSTSACCVRCATSPVQQFLTGLSDISREVIVKYALYLAMILVVSSYERTALGQSRFESSSYGYYLVMLADWTRIPDKTVQEAAESFLTDELRRVSRWDAAFQRDGVSRPFTYPYVIVQVMPYQPLRLTGGSPDRAEFWECARQLTGIDILGVATQGLGADNLDIGSGWTLTRAKVDDPNMAYEVDFDGDVAGIGRVAGSLVGRAGRRSLVQLAFYDLKSNWLQSQANRRAILNSFCFQPSSVHPAVRLHRLQESSPPQGLSRDISGVYHEPISKPIPDELTSPSGEAKLASIVKELLSEEWLEYRLKSHPKAQGLDISLKYPKSWKAEEGIRPHIVQKFTGRVESGLSSSCMVIVQSMPVWARLILEGEAANDALAENVRDMMPDGATLIDSGQTKLDGEPCIWLRYSYEGERAGFHVRTYILQLMLFRKGSLIAIDCGIGGVADDEILNHAFASYQPVFQMIGNSVVIHDKWQAVSSGTDDMSSAMRLAFGDYWLFNIVLSLILTWGIGLLPPVLVRFVILHRPIARWAAITLVVAFLFVNLIIFTALGSKSKTHGALLLVAFASYAILRRGHRQQHIRQDSATTPSGELHQYRAEAHVQEESQGPSTCAQAPGITDYVQHELEKVVDRRHECATPDVPVTPHPTFSEQPPDVEPMTPKSVSCDPSIEESSETFRDGNSRPVRADHAVMVILALAACAGEVFAYAVVGTLLGWQHGGGVIPMMVLFAVLCATWRAITKQGSRNVVLRDLSGPPEGTNSLREGDATSAHKAKGEEQTESV